MVLQFTAPVQAHVEQEVAYPRLPEKPFSFPKREENEALHEYVVIVKADAPLEYASVGGVMFQKYLVDPEASIVGNESKPFSPRVPVLLFTERQAKALWERVCQSEFAVPRKRSPGWKPFSDKPEWCKAYKIELKECLVLCKKSEFVAKEYEAILAQMAPTAAPAQQDAAEEFKEAIYDAQIKKGKKS